MRIKGVKPKTKESSKTRIQAIKAIGITTIGGLLSLPFVNQELTKNVDSSFAGDLSLSNQKHLIQVKQACLETVKNLTEGDRFQRGWLADNYLLENGQTFADNQREIVEKKCQGMAQIPDGLGQAPGTDLAGLIKNLQMRANGRTQPQIAIIATNAAEPIAKQSLDLNQAIAGLLNQKAVLVIVGPDLLLRDQLKNSLEKYGDRFKICTYDESSTCITEGFSQARSGF